MTMPLLPGPAGSAGILVSLVVCAMAARWYRRHLTMLAQWPSLSPARARRRAGTRAGLHVIAAACLAAALFEAEGPGKSDGTGDTAIPPPVLFLLDVSRSMEVADLEPSRQAAAIEVLRRVTAAGTRHAGLMIFAGEALLVCPLTTDIRALQLALDDVSNAIDGLAGGSAIELAVAEGLRTMLRSKTRGSLVLLSDGEGTTGTLAEVTALAASARIPIHAVGLGTVDGGVMATRRPAAAPGEVPGYRLSRLNVAALQNLAALTSGRYISGGIDEATRQVAAAIGAGDQAAQMVVPAQSGWGLLLAALVALTGELVLRGPR